jgi:hypothetical protein
MIAIQFQGWFQCRLANDPDPTDEPRGVSGSTFATVDEPDLDRVICLQPPADPRVIRSFSPPIGVSVYRVDVDGQPADQHPLLGAAVSLLDEAKFVEWNGVVTAPNQAFIDPFVFQIRQGDALALTRAAVWDVVAPNRTYYEVPPSFLAPRQTRPDLSPAARAAVGQATGIVDPLAFWERRQQQLQDELAGLPGGTAQDVERRRVAIEQRLAWLDLIARSKARCPDPWSDCRGAWDWRALRAVLLLVGRVDFAFPLNAAEVDVIDAAGVFSPIDRSTPWPLSFWMGAWDNDTLCGFMQGNLQLP